MRDSRNATRSSISPSPKPEAPSFAEASEIQPVAAAGSAPIEADVPEPDHAQPVLAAADPYATDVPKAEPATSPEFVAPMPPTPIKDLPNAIPKPVEKPTMNGRYAIAGLKPILTARPAGSATPIPEKKKGLFDKFMPLKH